MGDEPAAEDLGRRAVVEDDPGPFVNAKTPLIKPQWQAPDRDVDGRSSGGCGSGRRAGVVPREVQHTRHDVQVGQPWLCHETTVV
jgi:hypothetical protein